MDIHGSSNVALGTRAGLGMKGSGNIIMGTVAGSNAGKNADGTDGTVLSNSIIMGTQAGNNAGGDKNIILGNYMNNAVMANNVVAVGSNSRVTKQFGLGLGHGIINDAQYGLAVGSYNKLSETAKNLVFLVLATMEKQHFQEQNLMSLATIMKYPRIILLC